jgi:hypothetical protein
MSAAETTRTIGMVLAPASSDSSATAFNGISGISGPFAGWLVGVFETDTEPIDPPPARLNFNTIGTNFTMLSPAINQLFFIGDGLSGHGSGSVQQFAAPANATRLFLGISERPVITALPEHIMITQARSSRHLTSQNRVSPPY